MQKTLAKLIALMFLIKLGRFFTNENTFEVNNFSLIGGKTVMDKLSRLFTNTAYSSLTECLWTSPTFDHLCLLINPEMLQSKMEKFFLWNNFFVWPLFGLKRFNKNTIFCSVLLSHCLGELLNKKALANFTVVVVVVASSGSFAGTVVSSENLSSNSARDIFCSDKLTKRIADNEVEWPSWRVEVTELIQGRT